MTHIIFENPGEIDPRAAWTFGVNVKEGDTPIGFFGTGLKYAVAILLRTGHKVRIQSGETEYIFGTNPTLIRGKEFSLVTCNNRELGFTLDVGRKWEVWMAYRELMANALDENGHVYQNAMMPAPSAGCTRVVVTGEGIVEAYNHKGEIFLETEPFICTSSANIHPGQTEAIFYRGFKVAKTTGEGCFLATYNVIHPIDLTEDRTAKYGFEPLWHIENAIMEADDEAFVRQVISAREGYAEREFSYSHCVLSPLAESIIEDLVKDRLTDINPALLKKFREKRATNVEPTPMKLTSMQEAMLKDALEFASSIGFPIDYPILVVESLGENMFGMAKYGKIYLSSLTFNKGTRHVAETLIEEYIHLKHSFPDCSRSMQEFLLSRLVSLGEELRGKPL